MSAKTKIVVLHLKELIYTGIFAALGILFIVLLIIMFLPEKEETDNTQTSTSSDVETLNSNTADNSVLSSSEYRPGIYTTEIILNDQSINLEVIVGQDEITSIRLIHLDDSITTMFPLLQPTLESLTLQIYESQSLENITYQTESKYTSLVLLEAIKAALEKAQPTP